MHLPNANGGVNPMTLDRSTNDTSPEVERLQLEIYRKMTPGRRWRLMDGMYRMARQLHAAGVRMENPQATDDEVLTAWFKATLDRPLFEEVEKYRHELARRII
jgi:hypothetical protein